MHVENNFHDSPLPIYLDLVRLKVLGWAVHLFSIEHLHLCAGTLTNQQKS